MIPAIRQSNNSLSPQFFKDKKKKNTISPQIVLFQYIRTNVHKEQSVSMTST